MVTITLHCPHCQSNALVRNGHAPNGKQLYRCRACGRQSRENPTPHAYPPTRREEILHASSRTQQPAWPHPHIRGFSHDCVQLDQKKGAQLPPLGTTLLAPNPDDPASTQHTAVGKETGETAHVERWNNTLRQRLACFVRMTLSFSKSVLMHKNCFWCKQQMGVTVR